MNSAQDRFLTRLSLGLLLLIITLATAIVFSYRSNQQLIQSYNYMIQTIQAHDQIGLLLSNLRDAESSQRGFLLTGREYYLEPYETSTRTIPQTLLSIRKEFANDLRLQNDLDNLERLVEAKLKEMRETIALKRANKNEEATRLTLTDVGQITMKQIRKIVNDVLMTEEDIVRERKAETALRILREKMYLGLLFVCSSGLAVWLVIQKFITRRLRLAYEVELESRNEKLRQVMEDRQQVFSIIAHDLKGLFAGVMMMSDVMRDKKFTPTEQRLRDVAGQVHLAVNHVYGLLVNLLDWARFQLGEQTLQPAPVQIRDVVKRVFDLFESHAQEKTITLVNEVPEDWEVTFDGQALQTILRNLVSNAIRFSAPDQKVVVSATKEAKGAAIVVVKDTGPGLPEGFARAMERNAPMPSQPGNAGERGAGIGLLVSRELLAKAGGRLTWCSKTNEGSTFTVVLPNASP